MDILQLPPTQRENKYLLVLIDILTRYAVAVPLKGKSALQVTTALKRFVLHDRLLGAPAILLTDNGLEFANRSLDRLLRRYGTKQVFTTPYNPKANGATERLNRTLMSLLRGMLTPTLEWDIALQAVLDIYNNCSHSSTGFSPYEAMTGRPPRHPQIAPDIQDALTASSANIWPTEATLPSTNTRLRSRHASRRLFTEAWSEAEQVWQSQLDHHFGTLHDEHAGRKFDRHRRVDSHREDPSFVPNDLVVIRDVHRPLGVEGKLRRPYVGPWVVTAVHPNKTATLADLEGHALSRDVPFDHMRAWRIRQQPPPLGQGGEDVARPNHGSRK